MSIRKSGGTKLNPYKHIVFVKGKDQTEDVRWIEYKGGLCSVTYQTGGKYNYSRKYIDWIKLRKEVEIGERIVHIEGIPEREVKSVLDFGEWYRIVKNNGYKKVYPKSKVGFYENALTDKRCKDVFDCIKQTAIKISLEGEGNYNILGKQYSKISKISAGSVLGSYLSRSPEIKNYNLPFGVIYPFGLNRSQKIAVENSLTSQISIIQGPPGTGKTQTILNIIANALINNKTIAVVSNNNSATQNVVDKLKRDELDFLTAYLGNTENKEEFINNQGDYPSAMPEWILSNEIRSHSKDKIVSLTD